MIKVVSIPQPWASLIVLGHKQMATFKWNTDHRGPLLIHAQAGMSKKQADTGFAINYDISPVAIPDFPFYKSLPLGAIIGKVYLMDTASTNTIAPGHFHPATIIGSKTLHLHRLEKLLDDYSENRFAWLFWHPQHFEKPISIKSESRRLWEYDERKLFLSQLS